jgi:hypothetical protein
MLDAPPTLNTEQKKHIIGFVTYRGYFEGQDETKLFVTTTLNEHLTQQPHTSECEVPEQLLAGEKKCT